MTHRPRFNDDQFNQRVEDLLQNLESNYKAFIPTMVFDGPSLYFHLEALKTSDWERKLEMIYAVLVSWGMHRMGPKGAKMVGYKTFTDSLKDHHDKINEASKWSISDVLNDLHKWDIIINLFETINVMETNTRIVGNSKVLAHLLPNLISPIDRTYTFVFLRGNTNFQAAHESWWFENITKKIFYPVAQDDKYKKFYGNLKNKSLWDNSPLKTIDNLIIGSILNKRNGIVPLIEES
jgi:hypothetical protein